MLSIISIVTDTAYSSLDLCIAMGSVIYMTSQSYDFISSSYIHTMSIQDVSSI